jgi:hypothetical protein
MSEQQQRSVPPRLNPELKKAVLRWEAQAAETWTRMLRDPLFLRQMWRTVEGSFHARQTMTEQLARHAAEMGLPSQAQQEALNGALNDLETRLAQLEESIDRLLEDTAS